MLKSHCLSQLVLLDKMFAVYLFITLGESVFRNIDRPCLSVYFLCIFFCFIFYVLGKRDDKNKRKVI